MRKHKYILWPIGLFLMLFSIWFFYLRTARENRLMKEGDVLVERIEIFKAKHYRLPKSLEEIGIKEREGANVLYYDKRDSLHYTVSFGTSWGESKIYYSDSKSWEDRYREIK